MEILTWLLTVIITVICYLEADRIVVRNEPVRGYNRRTTTQLRSGLMAHACCIATTANLRFWK
ncbi:hypothetical protein [Photorhabdus asymbiotica]|uniref:hypothetical protein n=1 Tax=Photorhabdus asymbiotica TaxID=291112 RepID=UPI003DA721A2